MRIMKRVLYGVLIFVLLVIATVSYINRLINDRTIDMTTVQTFNVAALMGEWHQIARFDHTFERHLKKCKVRYTMLNNGLIEVVNGGYVDSTYLERRGKLRIGKPYDSGYMRVSYFWFFYAPYRFLLVGSDYRYVVVSIDGNQLWVLSRKPFLEISDIHTILQDLRRRGFDIQKLQFQ